ncbi:sigma-54 interaction domain-containing protein [Portibacter lacus]|uniref:Sigma-54 factor interaction domain-containing protein n=1 Tax=Portibacter lacus TaxID=1099794 RepID=A0AA37SQP8_9BACT|nr:sigma-54 dependent transcriptional regulator [Portibacter lacus]GLR18097.1 hypothetical protein GCM10007940_27120 [Portibacter lacus]
MSISPTYCIFNSNGEAIYISDELYDFLKLDKASSYTIFEINPEFSFLKWKEIHQVKTEDFQMLETSYLEGGFNAKNCLVKYLNFENFTIYYIIDDKEVKSKEAVTSYENNDINYDRDSPNPVIYFCENGIVGFKNREAEKYNPNSTNVTDLFLEPDSGPIADCVKGYQDDKEYVIRMIMRTNAGLKEGYSRIFFISSNSLQKRFRLEFHFSEKGTHFDEPLKEAMVELNRLEEVISSNKEIMIEDSIAQFSLDDIVTQSPKYKEVLRQVATVADTSSTVLITGETGTGKEMLCNTLYKLSDRAEEIIIKVNCATIPENLIESILFGHEKGSFTDAKETRIGKFELAHKGTIFLDEIGEMPYEMQAKLLRVLQEGEIERLGNPNPIKVDVRIIAATNRNLKKLIKEKKFREDLYYRLNVFPIFNLPLRERKEDIPLLTNHFIIKANKKTGREVKRIREQDIKLLEQYEFPGNVRELENIIERSVISSYGEVLLLNTFKGSPSKKKHAEFEFLTLEEAERNHIIKALKYTNGKVSGTNSASELLKLNSKTLTSRIKKLNINPRKFMN